MGKIVIAEFMSLDGVMEDPGGAEGTPHGGWAMPYGNDEIAAFKRMSCSTLRPYCWGV